MLGLPALKIPKTNPQSPEKIALGADLFEDTTFSQNQTISCASCHQAERAFSDGQTKAIGIHSSVGHRNSPTLINSAYYDLFFHDGRSPSLEHQVIQPMLNPIEHGLRHEQDILAIVQANPDYVTRFETIFTIQKNEITIQHIAKTLASYIRSLIKANTDFDRYYFGRDKSLLSIEAARGLKIFRRKGNCANCHEISWNQALFTDNRFYNIGIGSDKLQQQFPKLLTKPNEILSELNTAQLSELGRYQVTRIQNDIGKFKTPTLRNIDLTAPYMHDGSLKTLEEVVDYYDQGGKINPWLDPAIFPLNLTDQEKKDLVAFMKSLSNSPD